MTCGGGETVGAAHYVSRESPRRDGAEPRRREEAEAEAEPQLGKILICSRGGFPEGFSSIQRVIFTRGLLEGPRWCVVRVCSAW